MDVAVVKHSGEKTGRKINLSAEVFGIEPNDHAIWLDVKSYLANQQQGRLGGSDALVALNVDELMAQYL